MNERISELRAAGEAAIAEAPDTAELEDVRVRFLGRKAELPNLLRGVAQLPPEERGTVGRAANEARKALEAAIEARAAELEAAELDSTLAADVIDVTLPGSPAVKPGRVHLLTAARREIEDIFLGLGFRVMEGPETELVYYNFDALNFDETHPSRQATDTFYISDERLVRLRPHFFPFTEPSVECDVSCFNCIDGFLRDGSRCPLCKGEGWIEILGAGEVDPNVFGYVRENGYDPDRHQGFPFGMGIERIAMLKHGVSDLRLFYDNDLRFLEQFG